MATKPPAGKSASDCRTVPNRALGLLATSTTGFTAFGAKFVNETAETLKYMTLQFTGEVWRQSDTAKTLQVYYFVDPTATGMVFPTASTSNLPSLNVNFPTFAADKMGVAVDGTGGGEPNQPQRDVNQVINWPPGAALWLTWEMASVTGKAQGLGIDDLSFSALPQPPGLAPMLSTASRDQRPIGAHVARTVLGPTYQNRSQHESRRQLDAQWAERLAGRELPWPKRMPFKPRARLIFD